MARRTATTRPRSAKNVRQLLMREFGVYLRYNYAHTVFPLRRWAYDIQCVFGLVQRQLTGERHFAGYDGCLQ